MLRLQEDTTKEWLRAEGLPVPEGGVAETPKRAKELTRDLPSRGSVIKALLPFGRRGKAGAVLTARDPEDAEEKAHSLLGQNFSGIPVESIYVEEKIQIDREFYLAFMLTSSRPQILASRHGGIDIENASDGIPDAIIRRDIDPPRGLPPWDSRNLWREAGISGQLLLKLSDVTSRLYDVFYRGDGLLLELNPIVIDQNANLVIVGAMAGIDPAALPRHPEWADVERKRIAGLSNSRERQVAQIDLDLPGEECRYIELDGEIGLLVGGGGAGLYQHDLVLAAGSAPANHSVTPPTGTDTRKLEAVINAILENPSCRALLVGFNFTQMARADLRVKTLVKILEERNIDTSKFPIVIRLFGNGESAARDAVAGRPGVHYMARGTSLEDAVNQIVHMLRKIKP